MLFGYALDRSVSLEHAQAVDLPKHSELVCNQDCDKHLNEGNSHKTRLCFD
jgi:hypothetical protein